jgi:hypothetical protein
VKQTQYITATLAGIGVVIYGAVIAIPHDDCLPFLLPYPWVWWIVAPTVVDVESRVS